eukprot:RCo028325
MRSLSHSCDFLLKLDTDELVTFVQRRKDGSYYFDPGAVRCQFELLNVTGGMYAIRRWYYSVPDPALCGRDPMSATLFQPVVYPLGDPIKVFHLGWSFAFIDLGAHNGTTVPAFKLLPKHDSGLAMAHYHFRCYEDVMRADRTVMISHRYISANADVNATIRALEERLKGGAKPISFHKARRYLQHLKDPVASRKNHYRQRAPHYA